MVFSWEPVPDTGHNDAMQARGEDPWVCLGGDDGKALYEILPAREVRLSPVDQARQARYSALELTLVPGLQFDKSGRKVELLENLFSPKVLHACWSARHKSKHWDSAKGATLDELFEASVAWAAKAGDDPSLCIGKAGFEKAHGCTNSGLAKAYIESEADPEQAWMAVLKAEHLVVDGGRVLGGSKILYMLGPRNLQGSRALDGDVEEAIDTIAPPQPYPPHPSQP